MKNLILVIMTICCFQVVNSQNIDQATISKIKVKLISAEKLYEQGEYYDALKKIEEIETLARGFKSAKAQNLKVKAYLGYEMYKSAKRELDLLYEMNPNEDIINDIVSYESKIDHGVAEEKAEKERARLAEMERKEEVRLAQIREEEKRKKIKKAISNFEFAPCNKCKGQGIEDYEASKKCTAYYSGPNRGGGNRRYYFGCNEGKCKTRKKGEPWEYFTCTTCNGSGRIPYKKSRACTYCQGELFRLNYIGNDYLKQEEIDNVIKNNFYQILQIIHKKEGISFDTRMIDIEYIKKKVLGKKIGIWSFDGIHEFIDVKISKKEKLQNDYWKFEVEFLLDSEKREQHFYLKANIYFFKGYKSWVYTKGIVENYNRYSNKNNL